MKILGQRLSNGSVEVIEAPSPALVDLSIRVTTLFSAVSSGTEGGKVAAGRMSLLEKARSRPDQVRQVLEATRSLGLTATIRKIRTRLEGAQPLGYSLCGRVAEVGKGAGAFTVGSLVACAGGGYANHADEVVVPVNLAVAVPDAVQPEAAAFTTLGAIAMQGVRLARPGPGDCALVIGLGMIGQLACQILRASGCRVFGTDISDQATTLARHSLSADAAIVAGPLMESSFLEFSRGRGADIVLICAGSKGNGPIEMAGALARRKGRVVVVGAVGMQIPREPYYRKELELTVSCSYGPGRYDPSYEEAGLDYPLPFVRWTEQRNMEAVLDLMAAGSIDPLPLIESRVPFEQAPSIYSGMASGNSRQCGILIEYPSNSAQKMARVDLMSKPRARTIAGVGLGLLGSGSFAQSFLLPHLRHEKGITLVSICTRTGLSSADIGSRAGFRTAVDSLETMLQDPDVGAVAIAARHDLHGPSVVKALSAGRHVFVEKPLCITREELQAIGAIAAGRAISPPVLQVGFNRRFSPSAMAVKRHFSGRTAPMVVVYRINAGRIPRDSWIQDPVQGGGRIVGEACHFIDLMQYLTDSEPVRVSAACIRTADSSAVAEDCVVVNLEFGDGSVGSMAYLSEGAKVLPKERVEVHSSGLSAVIDNFSSVELIGGRVSSRRKLAGKGYPEEIHAFIAALSSGVPPIPIRSLLATTETTFCILDSLRSGGPVPVDVDGLFRP